MLFSWNSVNPSACLALHGVIPYLKKIFPEKKNRALFIKRLRKKLTVISLKHHVSLGACKIAWIIFITWFIAIKLTVINLLTRYFPFFWNPTCDPNAMTRPYKFRRTFVFMFDTLSYKPHSLLGFHQYFRKILIKLLVCQVLILFGIQCHSQRSYIATMDLYLKFLFKVYVLSP